MLSTTKQFGTSSSHSSVPVKKDNVKVHIGLTKKINSLLKSTSNLVKDVDRSLFCHPDITCHLKIRWKDKSKEDDYSTSIDNLKDHLEGLI